MRREEKFAVSKRMYAADLSSLSVTPRAGYQGREYFECTVRAVWFRRRRRGGFGPNGAVVTVACIGTLWGSQDTRPATAAEFLEHHTDGRHGGDCAGRWDGERYWGTQEPDRMNEHLALLKPMLANYPAAPAGFDAWWRF